MAELCLTFVRIFTKSIKTNFGQHSDKSMSIVQEGRGLIIADVLDCLLPCFLVNVVCFSASLNVGLFVDLLVA